MKTTRIELYHGSFAGPVLASAGPRTVRYLRGPHMGIEILRGNPCFSHQMLFPNKFFGAELATARVVMMMTHFEIRISLISSISKYA